MRTTGLLISACFVTIGLGPGFAFGQPSQPTKSTTLEGIGRGLKSADQHIEREIPKIGPAIGETVKKVTGNTAAKTSTPSPSKDKK